jgi:type I restriction enzyme M protein
MLDARNVYRKVTRKIYDFSPEQLANLTAVVWLYRGQSDRFLELVQSYLDRTFSEAALIADHATAFSTAYKALVAAAAPFLKFILPSPSGRGAGGEGFVLRELIKERDAAAKACRMSMNEWTGRIAKDWKKHVELKASAQRKRLEQLDPLAQACRDLVKDVDLVCKLAGRVVDTAEKEANAREHEDWDSRAIGRLEKDLDARRKELVEQLKRTAYFER